jgi:hypothetical protein
MGFEVRSMNNFRATLSGRPLQAPELLGTKQPSRAEGDGLDAIPVAREAVRTADHRAIDRHRLVSERAVVCFRGSLHPVELVNLSGGGAMVEGSFKPRLWDKVDLNLGENGSIECAVRWIRGDRYGLEFAHETQIQAEPEQRDELLREVLRRSFPDIGIAPAPEPELEPEAAPVAVESETARRGSPRHPMIWSGQILFRHDTSPVRLRNISTNGAMVETAIPFPVGAEVYLDLGDAGSLFASISWVHGDQVGLVFAHPYDIANLAKAKPSLTPQRWSKPDYLRDDQADSSPWADRWGRLSVEDLKDSLEGFMKH